MITLETGVPGAGKTLYCVDKLMRLLVGTVVHHENESGEKVQTARTIYTNVNGLLLEHEKIGPGAAWSHDGKTDVWSQPVGGDLHGLNNWHEWAKPGSIIVYDEVQKPWPLAASGSKVPPCITALETHRHMGVDFIVLTQHPMLIHANLVRLVGRHLHIRRMGNMGLAIVYEWDSCSKTLLYKNSLSKAAYHYSKDVFQLYKSAELHTKTPRRIPSLVWGALFGLLAFFAFSPSVFSRIGDRISPPKLVSKAAGNPVAALPVVPPAAPASGLAAEPVNGTVAGQGPVPVAVFSGCISRAGLCKCFDASGKSADQDDDICEAMNVATKPVLSNDKLPDDRKQVSPRASLEDLDMIDYARKHRSDDQARFHVPKAAQQASL